jgi:hypothetical protein
MTRKVKVKAKLSPDELARLSYLALKYHSAAKQLLSMQDANIASEGFRQYHDWLGEKYGYDPSKASFSPDGEVTIQ